MLININRITNYNTNIIIIYQLSINSFIHISSSDFEATSITQIATLKIVNVIKLFLKKNIFVQYKKIMKIL